MTERENSLFTNKHFLVYIDEQLTTLTSSCNIELEYIKNNFCGNVIPKVLCFSRDPTAIIYLCGDIEKNYEAIRKTQDNTIYVIENLSYNYDRNSKKYKIIDVGQVPINIHNTGVYFRNLFNSPKDYFDLINKEHQFQVLTESNKSSDAYRTGIYLAKVEESDDGTKFNLLRCSSNLHGPTDNFRNTDREIIDQSNDIVKHFFGEKTELNHVLAQIYNNKIVEVGDKRIEKKAKISDHSDKTKDMPKNGLIVFCTFYMKEQLCNTKSNYVKKSFDYCYKDTSVLTKIHFRLKKDATNQDLKKDFYVTLYPNSAFFISLLTNRLYTHEIVPSTLPIDKIPTRMGYVIRCSNMEAIFKDGQTYINENGKHIKLEEPDKIGVSELKHMYFEENSTSNMISYDKLYFSLNRGDYMKPIV